MDTVVGYGRTYDEALADAERNIRLNQVEEFAATTIGTVIWSWLGITAIAIIKPVCGGLLYLSLFVFARIAYELVNLVFPHLADTAGTVLIFGFLGAAVLGMVALSKRVEQEVDFMELRECWLIYHVMKRNQSAGRALHMLLFAFTAWLPFMLFYRLFEDVAILKDSSFPLLGIIVGGVVAAVAVATRRRSHPFARHFTLDGRLRHPA